MREEVVDIKQQVVDINQEAVIGDSEYVEPERLTVKRELEAETDIVDGEDPRKRLRNDEQTLLDGHLAFN